MLSGDVPDAGPFIAGILKKDSVKIKEQHPIPIPSKKGIFFVYL